MNKQQVIEKISKDLFPNGPEVPKHVVCVKGQDVVLFDGDETVEAVYEFSQIAGVVSLVEVPKQPAEQWLTKQGYSSTSLVTLLDLETRLAAAQKTAPKLVAVRAWVNGILGDYVANQAPRYVWPAAPYPFNETTTEAFIILSTAVPLSP